MAYICILIEHYLYNKLIQEFNGHTIFSRDDLKKFLQQYKPELNEATFTWRVFDLKRRNIISNLKRGFYTLNNKAVFEPPLNDPILPLSKLIGEGANHHIYNICDTIWLNDLTELQATLSQIVLEVEKGLMEKVFFTLRDNGFTEVFIKPDESIIKRHVSEARHPVIIKPFITRSPIHSIHGIMIPTLEKILVDLYCDDLVYFAFQGHQMEIIYRNAVTRYALNFSKLFTYAKRRSREDEIKNLLLKVMGKDLKEIIK